MKILLYNPDNGVTRNFMPHLWMFLLQALTPPHHQVRLIDANARPMSDDEIVQFVREQKIQLCDNTAGNKYDSLIIDAAVRSAPLLSK